VSDVSQGNVLTRLRWWVFNDELITSLSLNGDFVDVRIARS